MSLHFPSAPPERGGRTNMPDMQGERERQSPGRKPKAPQPKQHQEKPGKEAALKPRPKYEAPEYKAAGKLAGKVALVTGGDSGIGRAVAVLFAREGADVAFTHLPQEQEDAGETAAAVEEAGVEALAL